MAKKKKEFSEDYVKGFADGIKTNQAEWIDIIEAKIRYYNSNRNSGNMAERVNKVAVLEELKKEV